MDGKLKKGLIYSQNELINFLSDNFRDNVLLVSEEPLNLLECSSEAKFEIKNIEEKWLHKFNNINAYNETNRYMLFYIKQI